MNNAPIMLVDCPEDGYCEDHGWVEATVSEDSARDLLAECVTDEDGNLARPVGPATKVRMLCRNPDADGEDIRWHEAETGDEFWRIDCSVTETLDAEPTVEHPGS